MTFSRLLLCICLTKYHQNTGMKVWHPLVLTPQHLVNWLALDWEQQSLQVLQWHLCDCRFEHMWQAWQSLQILWWTMVQWFVSAAPFLFGELSCCCLCSAALSFIWTKAGDLQPFMCQRLISHSCVCYTVVIKCSLKLSSTFIFSVLLLYC